MRWLIRRICFYVFALWVAITLNFLLPRLMPGDPAGGVLQRMSSAQLASNPGLIQTYRDLLGGGHGSLFSEYVGYLHRVVTLNFGISTSNYPTRVSTVIGNTLALLDLPRGRRLHPRVHPRHHDRHARRLAAGRRRRQRRGADAAVDQRVSGVLHVARRRVHARPQARLVPARARVRHRPRAGVQLHVPRERLPPLAASDPRDHVRVRRGLGAQHADGDDQHDRGGLRRDGPRQGAERSPRDDALRRRATRSSRL